MNGLQYGKPVHEFLLCMHLIYRFIIYCTIRAIHSVKKDFSYSFLLYYIYVYFYFFPFALAFFAQIGYVLNYVEIIEFIMYEEGH